MQYQLSQKENSILGPAFRSAFSLMVGSSLAWEVLLGIDSNSLCPFQIFPKFKAAERC